ncbi:hypothetical protein PV327_003952 [Microctonus hyperodae]|uniref:Mutator-like transposase domain-containing protein n=1 Tax=Microctonus hyperodae TaxID=165561 RepID=A0AA39G533_MICHY|nr:hypothetical protein PV327_003952 [Microctonus hyperodae]
MVKRTSIDRKGSRSDKSFRPKKRKPPLRPNQMESETTYTSSAAKKSSGQLHEVSYDPNFSYCILQFTAVFAAISDCVVCRTCGGDIKFLKSSSRGLGFKLNVFCTKCDDNIQSVPSSPLINTAYEINRRFTFAMRLLGKGLKAMQLFCGVMDLPSCIAKATFDPIMKNIEEASTVVAKASMKAAAAEEVQESANQDKLESSQNGIVVSGDSTWKKRGLSSFFGVATLIGYITGKVIDFVVKSKYCEACEDHEKQEGTTEYESWLESHQQDCEVNHTGSSGEMEADSAVEMFQRSLENYGIKYEYYIDDAETKTFSSIMNAQPYEDLEVKKKECAGHVHKQNNNESLNSKIWKIAPKCTPDSKRIVDVATNIAVCTFNDGAEALLRMERLLGITIGYEGYHYCLGTNANRLKHARIEATNATKEARASCRLERNKQQLFIEKEGVQYGAEMGD